MNSFRTVKEALQGGRKPVLLSAEQVSKSVFLPPERILELAAAGVAPCVRVDGGPPKFYRKELMDWVQDNLLEIQEGKTFQKSVVITVRGSGIPVISDLPVELQSAAKHIREYTAHLNPVVYFLVKCRRVVYVGQASCLGARIASHLEAKDFDQVFYIPVDRQDLNEVESAFIAALQPKLNKSRPKPPDPHAVIERFTREVEEAELCPEVPG